MNKLDTNVNGGYPVELDDFRFLDDIYRTGIHKIIQSFSNFAILTGCEIGLDLNNDEKINAGWVVINGEIGFLPETIGLSNSQDYGVVADNYVDNSVVKITQAGQSIKPHLIRQFKVEPYHPTMGEESKLWQLKQVKEVLKSEFGLTTNTLKRNWIVDTPSSFNWNASSGRYEGVIAHGQNNAINGIQGVSILLHELTSGTLMSLPSSFGYQLNSTNIIIVDNSLQGSNDDWRGLILNGGLKIIFDYV